MLREAMLAFEASVAGAARGRTIRERLVSMGRAKHRFLAENPSVLKLWLREMGAGRQRLDTARESGPLLARSVALIAELVREGIDSGQFRQVDPALAAWFLLGVFNTFDMGMVSLGHVPADEEIEGIVDLALDGIKRR